MSEAFSGSQRESRPSQRFSLSWGAQIAIASIGAAVCWALTFIWILIRGIPQIFALHDWTRQTAPFFAGYILSSVFSAWIVILVVEVFLPFDLQSVGQLFPFVPVALSLLLGILLRHRWDPAAVFFVTVIPAILVHFLPLIWLERWVDRLVDSGDFGRAVRYGRLTASFDPTRFGRILLIAGCYSEAASFLRRSAFDKNGRPRLTDYNLYLYAMALLNAGRFGECQELLELAVSVPQEFEYFHIAMADCLLSQSRDPARAHSIIGEVMARFSLQADSPERLERKATCIALDAWAMARCGLVTESEMQIEMSRRLSRGLSSRSSAAVEHLIGSAWLALGKYERAKAAFEESLNLFPNGDIGLQARKSLAKLLEASEYSNPL